VSVLAAVILIYKFYFYFKRFCISRNDLRKAGPKVELILLRLLGVFCIHL